LYVLRTTAKIVATKSVTSPNHRSHKTFKALLVL